MHLRFFKFIYFHKLQNLPNLLRLRFESYIIYFFRTGQVFFTIFSINVYVIQLIYILLFLSIYIYVFWIDGRCSNIRTNLFPNNKLYMQVRAWIWMHLGRFGDLWVVVDRCIAKSCKSATWLCLVGQLHKLKAWKIYT